MSNSKYDYVAIRAEFVQAVPEISLRELARKHGMPGWSALSLQAKKGDWAGEREKFQRTLADREISAITSAIATKRASIIADGLDVIRAAIFKMAADMQDHWVVDPTDPKHRIFVPGIVITPDGLSKLLDRVLTMTGSASVITENRNVDLTPELPLPPEVARLLADIAGERSAGARPMGRAALPSAPGSREGRVS